jgi:SAM-dependent methyltransferase
MFDGKRWAEVPAVIDGLDALLAAEGGPRMGPGLRVLDSCCGPGRHSLELARRGCSVTGIDITDGYLEAARESAEVDGLGTPGSLPGSGHLEFLHADLRDFVRPAAFDLALNLFTSFGYFESREEDLKALARLRESLAPGGALIVEVIGKECAARDFLEGEWFERDGLLALTEYSVGGAWEYLENRWIVIREGRRFERTFKQRLYSAVELEGALRRAGFRGRIRFFGGIDGSAYDQKAASLVALAFGDG